MKNQLLDMLDNLDKFLDNMKSINEHPYSMGLNTQKLLNDLKGYISEMINVTNQIEEIKEAEIEPAEEETPSKN